VDLRVATRADGGQVVAITGDIDFAAVADIREAVIRLSEAASPLQIDLAGVTFIDSVGLGELVWLRTHAGACQAGLLLDNVPPHVARLLAMTGLDGLVVVGPRMF
jgi:anti-anti-sigma factor